VTRPKAVIIGTGALGLGFLAERLAGDYDLCLADLSLNEDLLRRIETDQSFTLNLCSLEGTSPTQVMGHFQVAFTDTLAGRRKLDQALLETDLVLTATGRRLLDDIVTMIAPALNAHTTKAWLLFCENGQHIAASYAHSFGPQTVLVDTVMSRMCRFDSPGEGRYQPLWSGCDRALIVEDDRFLPLDADRCRSGPFTPVFSLVSHAEFLMWEDIKLYMHNGMHAFVSYHAFLEGATLFANTPAWIRREAQRVILEELVPAIIHTHACARGEEIERYGMGLLERFFNPYFGDTVARGVRGAADKLAPDERLFGGCEFIRQAGIEPRGYAATIHAAREILERQKG
jgi:mannitol-1-phosphate/altronate dehydrogenase